MAEPMETANAFSIDKRKRGGEQCAQRHRCAVDSSQGSVAMSELLEILAHVFPIPEIALGLLALLGLAVAYVLGGAIKEAVQPESVAIRGFALFGHLLAGVVVGGVSLLLYPTPAVAPALVSAAALVVVPLITGLVARLAGNVRHGDEDRPIALTFQCGALFGFGVAAVRFAYVVSG